MRLTLARSLTLPLLIACDPAPLPTAADVKAAAADSPPSSPTLAALLYRAPVLPPDDAAVGRVRLLAWLLELDLDPGQLDRLDALRREALDQRARSAAAAAEILARNSAEERQVYDALFAHLSGTAPLDEAALTALSERLTVFSANGARERSLLTLRLEGIRRVLESESTFLGTLSEDQEARFGHALFALRAHLDPMGTPGDFDALVGPTFSPGEPGLLLRGTSGGISEPMDLARLFGAPGEPAQEAMPELRREAILYLVLHEPGLDEAIAAARAKKTGEGHDIP